MTMTHELRNKDAFGLEYVARTIHSWICWDREQHSRESIPTDDGTHVICLPVPAWPRHGQLENWRDLLLRVSAEMNGTEIVKLPNYWPEEWRMGSSKSDLLSVVRKIETELPGWWWRVGTCYLSDDAALGPDYNDKTHRERLLKQFPPEIFDGTIDVDRRPSGDLAAALQEAFDKAKELIKSQAKP